jgi:hypothetical protein
MEQDYVKCFFCERPVDPHGLGTYRKVVGWTKVRAQGGTNSISLMSPPMAYAHKDCVEIRKLRGESWDAEGQNSLF